MTGPPNIGPGPEHCASRGGGTLFAFWRTAPQLSPLNALSPRWKAKEHAD